MHVVYPVVLAALLFSIGVYGVLARRNTILVLMSVELMLNAVNLNLVAFDVWLRDALHGGQVLTLFVIVIAAAELGVGLAIVLAVFRNRQTVELDRLRDLAEPGPEAGPGAGQGPGPGGGPSPGRGHGPGGGAGPGPGIDGTGEDRPPGDGRGLDENAPPVPEHDRPRGAGVVRAPGGAA
ncbi:NADH-quinone oxidoreductase subunit NuoK [Sphaerisporangium perillae]|uniref:NADH-quinone oxidoreductase subunit NuoK n=1 Tax=Sphaerisporangium perillae TaxID=2935860 RepID=UPI003FD73459